MYSIYWTWYSPISGLPPSCMPLAYRIWHYCTEPWHRLAPALGRSGVGSGLSTCQAAFWPQPFALSHGSTPPVAPPCGATALPATHDQWRESPVLASLRLLGDWDQPGASLWLWPLPGPGPFASRVRVQMMMAWRQVLVLQARQARRGQQRATLTPLP